MFATGKITDENGVQRRILVRAKSNNGPDGDGYHYQIEQVTIPDYERLISSKVVWEEKVIGRSQTLLFDINEHGPSDNYSALTEAIDFLKVMLADGPMSSKDLDDRARGGVLRTSPFVVLKLS